MAYTTIKKPSDYFNTKLYTGTGAELAITGVGFQPDWTWIKRRDAVANGGMFDNVRGATKLLSSSQTDGEQTLAQSLKSFDSDGFTLGTGTNGYVNTSGSTTVAWNWLASNTTASNTDGSITSTVSANTTSGFSIVKYTGNDTAGATVGHGLGAIPKVIIIKRYTDVRSWPVYHYSIGNGNKLYLDLNYASASSTNWNSTTPDSSVFTISEASDVNGGGGASDYIAYCFAEVKGFSKFGSYTANASTDGTFTYTGFKPAFLMIKSINLNEGWFMYDTKRSTYNVVENFLLAHGSNAEETSTANSVDILSNGFKIRTTDSRLNSSGSYIYMAFAEEPLVGDNPCTAR